MTDCLAIVGASGHGKVVADAALLAGWQEVVFYDDRWPERSTVGPWPVAGTIAELLSKGVPLEVVVAIGDNHARLGRYLDLVDAGASIAGVVHPAAVVSPFARLGPGTVICANAVVGAFASTGAACIVNSGATIDHDCVLADGVHVSPGAHLGGGVVVGRGSWIGLGASIRHGIAIGSNVIVGAGAAVIGDVDDALTVVGVPARPLPPPS